MTDLSVFFDNGSTCSLILTCVAEKFGLQGETVKVTIGTVNGEQERVTKLYVVELITSNGDKKFVRALGMERISENIPCLDLNGIKHYFSEEVQKEWMAISQRPTGQIELLVGSEVAGIHPVPHETAGDLVVMKSIFGDGWTMYGHHPDLNCCRIEFSSEVSTIRLGGIKLSPCGAVNFTRTISYTQSRSFSHLEFRDCNSFSKNEEPSALQPVAKVSAKPNLGPEYTEDLGVEPPRRCSKCKGCKECSWMGLMRSERENQEYKLIEDGVKYCHDTGRVLISYPFLEDPQKLGNNFFQAKRIAEREEKRLAKAGMTKGANEAFQKMVDHNAIRRLSQMELDMWSGLVNYVSLQHVLNESYATTPLRICTNSSLRNSVSGLSLNDMLAKGPNYLSDTYNLLIRFRNYRRGLLGDLTKAYYSMATGLLEMHVRRVIWRWGNKEGEWEIWGYMVVSFGDRPAAALLEIVIRITVTMFGDIDTMASKKLVNDRFVDDLISGGTDEQVQRFMGNEDPMTLQCDGTMPTILSKAKLYLKALACTGEKDGSKLEKLGSAVLGIHLSTEADTIAVKLHANISPRDRRGNPTGPDLSLDTLEDLKTCNITRRLFLSVTNGIHDLLGLVSPLVIQGKVTMKELFDEEYSLDWDTTLPPELQNKCKDLLSCLPKQNVLHSKDA